MDFKEVLEKLKTSSDTKFALITFAVSFGFVFLFTVTGGFGISIAFVRSLVSSLFITLVVHGARLTLVKMLNIPTDSPDSSKEDEDNNEIVSESIIEFETPDEEDTTSNKEESEEEKRRRKDSVRLASLKYSAVDALEDDDVPSVKEAVALAPPRAVRIEASDVVAVDNDDEAELVALGEDLGVGEKSTKNTADTVDKNDNLVHNVGEGNISPNDGAFGIDSILSDDDMENTVDREVSSSNSGMITSGGRGMSVEGDKLVFEGKQGKAVIANDPEQIAKAIRTLIKKDEEE